MRRRNGHHNVVSASKGKRYFSDWSLLPPLLASQPTRCEPAARFVRLEQSWRRIRMLFSLKMLPVVICLFVACGLVSCQGRDEEPRQQPERLEESAPSPVLILPENSPALATIRTERATVRRLRRQLKAQAGKIIANENRLAHLSSRVPGRIVAVYVNLGDQVKVGDRLLLLDSPQLGAIQLEYRKASIGLTVQEKAFERAKTLLAQKVISMEEYQRAEGDYQKALAQVHESEEELHLLGMTEQDIKRLMTADLPHAQVAQVSLRASIPGEIVERNATVGEVVDPNKILFTIADLSTVWVRADFPEQQTARLKVGLSIELRVRAYPEEVFSGRILYVGAMVDAATRTVMVRSEVPNPDRRLRPEMFADVVLLTEEQPMLTVPRTAIQQAGDRTVAFVVRGPRRFERRVVAIGETAGEYVEVMGGLAEGDEVVTQGSYSLKSEVLREQMPSGGQL